MLEKIPDNQMICYEQALGDNGKEQLPFNKNPLQNQAQGGPHVCTDCQMNAHMYRQVLLEVRAAVTYGR